MVSNYNALISRLDAFIRKYYLDKMVRGAMYSIGTVVLLLISFALLEYYFYFSPAIRSAMFYSFIGLSLGVTGFTFFHPMLKYFRLGALIDHKTAARIIGDHFVEVKDRLINILNLREQLQSGENNELLLASIDQKAKSIQLVTFHKAIDLVENKKYLPYTLPPVLILFFLLFTAPSILKESTHRLIYNQVNFAKPAPFQFVFDDLAPEVIQFGDYELEVRIEGNTLPDEVFIEIQDFRYRLSKKSVDVFSYTFRNVIDNIKFNISSSNVVSEDLILRVMQKPVILDFSATLEYPSYTGKKSEVLYNTGDFTVPVGTWVKWEFNTKNTGSIRLRFDQLEGSILAERKGKNLFFHKKKSIVSEKYQLIIENEIDPIADSVQYAILSIPDKFPFIEAVGFNDEINRDVEFFAGEISDDYGITRVDFVYMLRRKGEETSYTLPVIKGPLSGVRSTFSYQFNFGNLTLEPGDELDYYFEVFDNDQVNGIKSTKSSIMRLSIPSLEEFKKLEQKNEETIKSNLSKALADNKKNRQDLKKMREQLLQKKDLEWQDRKNLEKLLERQKQIDDNIEQAKKAFEENLDNQDKLNLTDEKIEEKQKQLEKLLEALEDKEMAELMQKIQDLLQELEKDQLLQMMQQMDKNESKMEIKMDRLLELFKQLEVEKEMKETISELRELAEKLDDNAKKNNTEEQSIEESLDNQNEINDQFEKIEEKIEEILDKNDGLQQPKPLDAPQKEQDAIKKELKKSTENLKKQDNKKAAESQKKASDQMKEMAQQMEQQMQGAEMEQMQEDLKSLRQLLENLVGISFAQEDLIMMFNETLVNTPKYVTLVQQQFKLKDDFKMVEDSLIALGRRVSQLESFVTDKVEEVKENMGITLKELEERRKPQASNFQQRVMTGANDLALMLSEVMNQMQQQMAQNMPGAQMCTVPNNSDSPGQKPQDKISDGQKSLNEEIQKRSGDGMDAKDFAEMAARQAALRKALKEKQKQLQEHGKGQQMLDQLIQEMDKVETDLVNKRLTNQMLKRQQDILTRLLEHENAEREKEFDEKRKAEAAKNAERTLPPQLEDYLKQRSDEIDSFKKVAPSLKPFYKQLVEKYLEQ
jgi:hypothetical protein